jgi:uncharacterized membrane protein
MPLLTDLLSTLGRLHPLLVHLPIGALFVLAFLELLARHPRSRHANASASWILAFTVPALLAAAACGWLLADDGGYGEDLLRWHRWTGLGATVAGVATGLACWLDLKKLYRLALAGALALTIGAGHFGGTLTHGSDYLTGRWLTPSDAPEAAGVEPPRAFAAEVKPILDRYCVGCHGPEKVKGELRLDSWAALLKGGENGPAVAAGAADGSELLKRVRSPLDADGHMPPEGKPQPTAAEVAQLQRGLEGESQPPKAR